MFTCVNKQIAKWLWMAVNRTLPVIRTVVVWS